MGLPREVAQILHSNEAARLRCHKSCDEAKGCIGLEALTLEQLQLLYSTEEGYRLTKLGEDAVQYSQNAPSLSVPPILKK
ncbi:hypothetical protein [Ascidiaceihabitans sp.]|uniref:hypothetical protein n=1 Tax=Ascidiaceihabitans sp. TaxID=1872644 RepID=UPI00329A7799